MSENKPRSDRKTVFSRGVRHHVVLVVVCAVLGAVAGWLYAGTGPTTYTSTTRVLVNPTVGNPFVPTPSAVRQDELTSLDTEAAVAQSGEVLGSVSTSTGLPVNTLQKGVQVTVPPNTQILEIAYSAHDKAVAHDVSQAIAKAYLDNRTRRFEESNTAQLDRVDSRITGVLNGLRSATQAAHVGTTASQEFHTQLATALRNELVSLRAQQTALQNSEAPSGSVISPASTPAVATDFMVFLLPLAGGLAGLGLGCLLALCLEVMGGAVRTVPEVTAAGLPVAFAVPRPGWRDRLRRRHDSEALDTTVRRIRATVLELDARPDVIAVAPAGSGMSNAGVSEALAESFAKAGHRVVLVRTDGPPTTDGLAVEEGLAQALLHERLNVLDLLQPSVEPLLCLLPSGGFTAQSREHLVADRVRAVITPLVEAGNLVVLQAPGLADVEGEAIVGAADLGLVVVTRGETRPADVEQAADWVAATREPPLAALVVGRRDTVRPLRLAPAVDSDTDSRADARTEAPREKSHQHKTVPRKPR
jgi:succinoglycan biosynthesis transport protein ExoP